MKIWKCLLLLIVLGGQSLQAQRLVSGQPLGQRSAAQLTAEIGIPMPNDVFLYKIQYETPDLHGITDTASGLLVVPDIPGQLPLICYQHGTIGNKADVPSNLVGEALLAMAFGSMGYAVVAPDYLGLGDSRGFHPYVHAQTEASAAIDLLYATQSFAPSISLSLSGQLFISGYSQGGHGAMALFRELEARHTQTLPVTAAAPMSGPYSISGEMKRNLFLNTPYFYPSYLPYTLNSFQMAYGNIYTELSDLYRPGYDSLVQDFLDRKISLGSLNTRLINKLSQDFGASIPRMMFKDSVQLLIQHDSTHPFNVAMRLNDVYDWTPQAPTRIFYCEGDDQVFYTNSIFTDSVMNRRGAADVKARSVGETLNHVDCVVPATLNSIFFFNGFVPLTAIESEKLLSVFWHVDENRFDFQLADASAGQGMFRMLDMQGKVILEQSVKLAFRQQIDLGERASGIYLVEISSEKGLWRKKLWLK